jgi:TRAP-type C4-dicarboxylate transport system permease large subunit
MSTILAAATAALAFGLLLRLPTSFVVLGVAFAIAAVSTEPANVLQLMQTTLGNAASSDSLVTIAMIAIAGELNRVMGAEAAVYRVTQSMLAGQRAAPVLAATLGSAMQGLLYLRSGRSHSAEVSRDMSFMLEASEEQGLSRVGLWSALNAGGVVALAWPIGLITVVAGHAFDLSVARLIVMLLVPWTLLFLVTIFVALLVGHTTSSLRQAPALGPSRMFQVWKDSDGIAKQLFLPLWVLAALTGGLMTPTEIGSWIAATGFLAAWLQPIRPRFKDLTAAFVQAAILTVDIVLLIVAMTLLILLLRNEPGMAVAWMAIAEILAREGMVAIALALVMAFSISFLLGAPVAILALAPLAGLLTSSSTPIVAVLIIWATLLGVSVRGALLPVGGSGLAPFGTRLRHGAIASLPALVTGGILMLVPEISLSLDKYIFGQ